MDEMLLYVPGTGFDATFFIWPPQVTSTWLEAIVCCKVQVSRMKERPFAAGMLQHSGLGIIDEHLKWNTAEELECVLMGAKEAFGTLSKAKLEVTQGGVAWPHNKALSSPPA